MSDMFRDILSPRFRKLPATRAYAAIRIVTDKGHFDIFTPLSGVKTSDVNEALAFRMGDSLTEVVVNNVGLMMDNEAKKDFILRAMKSYESNPEFALMSSRKLDLITAVNNGNTHLQIMFEEDVKNLAQQASQSGTKVIRQTSKPKAF